MSRENFALSPTHSDLLARLKAELELPSKKATIENALVILAWAVTEVANGRSIAAVDEVRKLYRPLTMPVLETARRKGERDRSQNNGRHPPKNPSNEKRLQPAKASERVLERSGD